MGEDARLRAVVTLAQAMAAAQTSPAPGPPASPHREPPHRRMARAAALGARDALDGSFAAVSQWDRGRGRLRVLVNVGELAEGEEEFPEDESYPVHDFPEITEFLHERWAEGGDEPHAWVERRDDPGGGDNPEAGPGGGDGSERGGKSGSGDSTHGSYCHQRVAALRRRGRGSCVVAPLVLHGRAWGELYVARDVGEPVFGRADADFATVLAAVVAAGVAQDERLEEVRKLAFTDPLTGLANRRAVDFRLDEALERHRTETADRPVVSLVVCDVNGLKRVNDEHGHEAGDRLLERFAALLSLCAAMLPGALAARLGGDEFCLLTVGPEADEVVRVAGELCRRAAELEQGDGVACGVASTGDPIGPDASARRLFRLADAAQYRAKGARAVRPVVAGRAGGADDPVVRLADAAAQEAPPDGPRRHFRGRA